MFLYKILNKYNADMIPSRLEFVKTYLFDRKIKVRI